MTARILQDASIEPPRLGARARGVVGIGWLALLVGIALLLGVAGYTLAVDAEAPSTVKLAVALVVFGFVVMLGYVLRVRFGARGRDPYEEIDQ